MPGREGDEQGNQPVERKPCAGPEPVCCLSSKERESEMCRERDTVKGAGLKCQAWTGILETLTEPV